MMPPLAVLGRRSGVVLLRRGGPDPSPEPMARMGPVRFRSQADAEAYLSPWLSDAAAMSTLRRVLHETGRGGDVSRRSDREVVRSLANALATGSLEVLEAQGERPSLNVAAAMAAAAAAAKKPAVRPPGASLLQVEAPRIPEPPLLPLLEEVQIEGAEVLPEILQTLEQVDISLGKLDLAALSLEPAPSAVPAIAEAMKSAAASVTSAMDGL